MLFVLRRVVSAGLALVVAATTVIVLGPTSPAEAQTFIDTAGTSHDRAVDVLAQQEVILGCSPTEFCPREPVTREQMASLLTRALDLPESGHRAFQDTSGTHAAAIDALAQAGITKGCSATEFCPRDPITRGEMARMLVRAFDPPRTTEKFFDDVHAAQRTVVNRLAASGIAAGCQRPLTAFCPSASVTRAQTAVFIARAMDLVDRVEVEPLQARREQQAALDRAREQAANNERWDRLAQCESGGNWSINTGNGYYGGVQFSLQSWRAVGGSGYPHQAPRTEQIKRAEMLLDRQGWARAWPYCSRQLGFR